MGSLDRVKSSLSFAVMELVERPYHDRFIVRSVCALGPILSAVGPFGTSFQTFCAFGPVFNRSIGRFKSV